MAGASTTGAVRARWLRAACSSSAAAVQPAARRLAAPAAAASRPRRAAALRRLQAGRGGFADRNSFSDEEDYFGERGSIDFDEEDLDLMDDGAMHIYLDSADIREIERWWDTGLFYGGLGGAGLQLAQHRGLPTHAASGTQQLWPCRVTGGTRPPAFCC